MIPRFTGVSIGVDTRQQTALHGFIGASVPAPGPIFGLPADSENCLAYALCMSGYVMPDGGDNFGHDCNSLTNQLMQNYGVTSMPRSGSCPAGSHAISIQSDGANGFHIQRQDGDGGWSDQSLFPTWKPRKCKPNGNCGIMCAPNEQPPKKPKKSMNTA